MAKEAIVIVDPISTGGSVAFEAYTRGFAVIACWCNELTPDFKSHLPDCCLTDFSFYGAAIAAVNAGSAGDFSDQCPRNQQSMLKNKLGKQAAEIAKAEVPMAELAMCAYRLVVEMITEIATHSSDCKHLVLIGGIQINMPEP